MRWVRVSHGVDHVVSHGFRLWDWSWGRSQCQSPLVITMIKFLEDLKYLIKCHFVFKVAVRQSASVSVEMLGQPKTRLKSTYCQISAALL